MMVETILESSQDFGMSNGPLPQWKRELLQRRAARSRPPAPPSAPPPQPPPPPPPPEEDEELRYGPGIVKRLKSRYLSLALREAPRRRPSVLRRAASLEHLLDERPPPAPRTSARPARPVSLAAPPPAAVPLRRDSVKRARSVDALSRLDEPSTQAPPSPLPRAPRPPRRPAPLLRDTERPPPDVVRSTLRKFETTPTRRPAPAARVSAVVRGLEAPRTSTPEPRARSPSPAAADISAIDEPESVVSVETKQVSRAALDEIARAGSTVCYSFESPKLGSHLPPLATTNPVLLNRARLSASPRRIGVIKPMPPPCTDVASSPPECILDVVDEPPRLETPPPDVPESPAAARLERKDPPPSAIVEPTPRTPTEETDIGQDSTSREPTPEVDLKLELQVKVESPILNVQKPLTNGHATPERSLKTAGVERAWTGAGAGGGTGPRRLRSAAPASTSVVFNFSHRKEVPDYIENDGIVLRSTKRNRFKAGESGVVLLKGAEVPADSDSEGEGEVDGARSPSPCSVRFVNDNVLINGRSSMLARTPLHRERAAKLKLQFDDSLTRTFEYPSETSLCEDEPAAAAPPAPTSALAANTTLGGSGGGSLSRYTPSKTVADTFQLGLSRTHQALEANDCKVTSNGEGAEAEADVESGDARPCAADSARSWSESRTHTTDLLF